MLNEDFSELKVMKKQIKKAEISEEKVKFILILKFKNS